MTEDVTLKKKPAKTREDQFQFLRQSARLEESAAPQLVRGAMWILASLVFGFIYWAAKVEIEEIAQAPGDVVPSGFSRIVQHFDGGIVKDILVEEGRLVKAGELLLKLDGVGAQEELNKAHIAAKGLENTVKTAREMFEMQQKLQVKGYSSKLKFLEARQNLDQATNEFIQQKEVIARLQDRVERLAIFAPVTGLIKGLKINTIGEVVKSGDSLMEIVPTGEKLVLEAHIPPNDIGRIKVGQKVNVKVSSFDYGRFGIIEGTLSLITATTFEGVNGQKYYRGRIQLKQNHVGRHEDMKILPGMTAQASIITGKKTVLAYLLKPVQRALADGLNEK